MFSRVCRGFSRYFLPQSKLVWLEGPGTWLVDFCPWLQLHPQTLIKNLASATFIDKSTLSSLLCWDRKLIHFTLAHKTHWLKNNLVFTKSFLLDMRHFFLFQCAGSSLITLVCRERKWTSYQVDDGWFQASTAPWWSKRKVSSRSPRWDVFMHLSRIRWCSGAY